MAIKTLCLKAVLPDPAADRKETERVEQYRVSGAAIYFKAFPGEKYLPFSAVERAWAQKSKVSLTGCCGSELPVVVLRVRYSGGLYQNFTFEKQESAERVLAALRAGAAGGPAGAGGVNRMDPGIKSGPKAMPSTRSACRKSPAPAGLFRSHLVK